jgi:hypothetical protein
VSGLAVVARTALGLIDTGFDWAVQAERGDFEVGNMGDMFFGGISSYSLEI